MKFEIEGFPHASQDTETMTCAETTLWALMEYFGNRYPEYTPVLPSKINQALKQITYERQIPSPGLYLNQLSFALKEFGFGPRIYSQEEYKDEFYRLVSCYVESGIPLIVAIENTTTGGEIRHAIICIGHDNISDSQINKLNEYKPLYKDLIDGCNRLGVTLYDYDDIEKNFIFIDDNCPVYQEANLKKPASHYPNCAWHNCVISYFIVPLYKRIYLEAYEAKNFILRLLILGPRPLKGKSEILIRVYLASNRTFKDNLTKNETFSNDIKYMILETPMPKFVWIAEISDRNLIRNNLANGIIILDATEANTFSPKPLIFGAYDDSIIIIDPVTKNLKYFDVSLQNFRKFDNNLKTN
ncbi:hypothetical protein JW887_05885 [Candidatus Dojkabacteria bacterium]|nr:hypothetical protein [Candidatus Dojkabacteria bacterium]